MNQYLQLLEEYFEIIENCSSISKDELLRTCAYLIPMIYAAAQKLPAPKEIRETEIEIEKESIAAPMGDLFEVLGDDAFYDEIFDPTRDEEPVKGCIADDLTDIYTDLKEGYLKWRIDTAESRDEALWDWTFSLDHHMGDHMVDVLRPLQRLVFFTSKDSEQGGADRLATALKSEPEGDSKPKPESEVRSRQRAVGL